MKTNKTTQNKKKGKMMYKYLIILVVLALFAVGCTDESNMISPADNTVSNNEVISNPNWITLPPAENQALKKDITVGKTIYGTDESLLEINTGYAGGPFGWISITANARFQRYSFTGSRYVTMSINDDFGAATFTPSGVWSKPVIYNLTIQGIDLSKSMILQKLLLYTWLPMVIIIKQSIRVSMLKNSQVNYRFLMLNFLTFHAGDLLTNH